MSAGNTLISMGVSKALDFRITDNDRLNQAIFSPSPEVIPPKSPIEPVETKKTPNIEVKEDDFESTVDSFRRINKLVAKRKIELDSSKMLLEDQINTQEAEKNTLIEENIAEEQKQSQLQIKLVTFKTSLEMQLNVYKQQFEGIIELANRVDNKETPIIEKIEIFNQQVAEIGEFLISIAEKDDENNTILQTILIDIANSRSEIARIESELKTSKEKVVKNKEKIAETNKLLETLKKDLEKLQKQIDIHQEKIRKAGAHALSVSTTNDFALEKG